MKWLKDRLKESVWPVVFSLVIIVMLFFVMYNPTGTSSVVVYRNVCIEGVTYVKHWYSMSVKLGIDSKIIHCDVD